MNETVRTEDKNARWLGTIDALLVELIKAPTEPMGVGGGMELRQAIIKLTEARFWLEARQKEIAEDVRQEALGEIRRR